MTRAQGDRGAAAVEFALILPLLLLLVFGIIDFGRAYNARITLSHAAREAVRVWALGGDYESTLAAARTAGLDDPDDPDDDITITTNDCDFGDPTTVTVTVEFTFRTPMIEALAPPTTSLSTEGVMRCGG